MPRRHVVRPAVESMEFRMVLSHAGLASHAVAMVAGHAHHHAQVARVPHGHGRGHHGRADATVHHHAKVHHPVSHTTSSSSPSTNSFSNFFKSVLGI